MKYNQPYDQPSNPNASYIDGNPAAGIQGSIVPAASIEFPQREIVNAIVASGQAGDNADLNQLLKMLKYMDVLNIFKMGVNVGNASQWSMSCPPLPTMPPPAGTAVWFKPGFSSVNGGTVFSLNGSPFMPVTNPDLTPIAIGNIIPSMWVLLFFDGAEWLLVAGNALIASGGGGAAGSIPVLQANANWYVNGTTGDDTNYDGTAATLQATTVHGPFKTLQRAANEVVKYNQNGYNQYVHVADGNYGPVGCNPTNGTGWCYWIGNDGAPQNCTVTNGASNASAIFQNGGYYGFEGFRCSATGAGASDGFTNNGGNTQLTNMRFGACTRFHIVAAWNGFIQLNGGMITIEGGANAVAHMSSDLNSQIARNPFNVGSLNVLGGVSFNKFMDVSELGVIELQYAGVGGGGFVHGPQYNVTGNAILNSLGGGSNYVLGDQGGSLSYGGQWIP